MFAKQWNKNIQSVVWHISKDKKLVLFESIWKLWTFLVSIKILEFHDLHGSSVPLKWNIYSFFVPFGKSIFFSSSKIKTKHIFHHIIASFMNDFIWFWTTANDCFNVYMCKNLNLTKLLFNTLYVPALKYDVRVW